MLAGILAPTSALSPIYVPDPNLYSMEEWAAEVARPLNDVPRLVSDDWRGWANALCLSRYGLLYAVPSPYQFDDWKAWAIRAYQVLA